MHEIRIQDLRAGQVFERPLFTPRGLMILPARLAVSAELIGRLANLHKGFVVLGDSNEDAPSSGRDTLRDGESPAAQSDARTAASADSGTTIAIPADKDQASDPERIARRASHRAWEFERNRLRIRAGLRRSAEDLVQSLGGRWARLPRRVISSSVSSDVARGTPNDAGSDSTGIATQAEFLSGPLALEMASERAERVAVLQRVWDRLLNEERVRAGVMVELVDELIDLMSRHADRFAAVALGARRLNESVAEHAYATGALSVAIAVRLGWNVWDVRTAGLSGMMADSGMLLLPTDVRHLARPLTEVEWNTMRRHPAYSLVLASHVLDMPEIVGLAAYQHHEREDGSGYPLGLRTGSTGGICDMAKVVAVADVLAGASAVRPHRMRFTAHGAVQLVVRQAAAGQLDRTVVRAAVRAVGVFPAGSYVRLSTGDVGMVEGVRDPDRADRPVVRLLEPAMGVGGAGFLEIKPDMIDLTASDSHHVSVVEALDVPDDAAGAMLV